MGPEGPGWPGWLLSLNYLQLGLRLHSHPRHPLHSQGHLQPQSEQIDIFLLGKDTCGVGYACNLCYSLDHSLVCDTRP